MAPAPALESHDGEPPAYEPLYLAGIEKFNECEYFESHEIWEELWTEYRGDSRKFYQGLIQAAVALYHFGNGNIRGARKLHASVNGYLETYKPRHLGLDVTAFLDSFNTCLAAVAASTDEFPEIELDPGLLPEIHLDPPPAGPASA
jgi:predicted metal-dependent hydrolase